MVDSFPVVNALRVHGQREYLLSSRDGLGGDLIDFARTSVISIYPSSLVAEKISATIVVKISLCHYHGNGKTRAIVDKNCRRENI